MALRVYLTSHLAAKLIGVFSDVSGPGFRSLSFAYPTAATNFVVPFGATMYFFRDRSARRVGTHGETVGSRKARQEERHLDTDLAFVTQFYSLEVQCSRTVL